MSPGGLPVNEPVLETPRIDARVALEWPLARRHLVQQHAEREDVGARIETASVTGIANFSNSSSGRPRQGDEVAERAPLDVPHLEERDAARFGRLLSMVGLQ